METSPLELEWITFFCNFLKTNKTSHPKIASALSPSFSYQIEPVKLKEIYKQAPGDFDDTM